MLPPTGSCSGAAKAISWAGPRFEGSRKSTLCCRVCSAHSLSGVFVVERFVPVKREVCASVEKVRSESVVWIENIFFYIEKFCYFYLKILMRCVI